MTRLIRWTLAVVIGALAFLPASPASGRGAVSTLDGVQLRYLPPGLGGSTDFDYEYDDVSFVARVWESGSDADGWSVDLDVDVMRGDRLASGRALHDWFIPYEDRPAGEVHYRPVSIHGRPGWATRDEVFWLVRPGLAMAVTLDALRWSHAELMHTALGARPVRRADGAGRRSRQSVPSGPFAEARTRSISQYARSETILPSASTR